MQLTLKYFSLQFDDKARLQMFHFNSQIYCIKSTFPGIPGQNLDIPTKIWVQFNNKKIEKIAQYK